MVMLPTRMPESRWGKIGFILLLVFGVLLGVGLAMATDTGSTNSSTGAPSSNRYGVEQVYGQEWAPFYAHELIAARAYMKAHPVKLKSGQVEAAIIRTVVSQGDGTATCGAWGDCWKALVLYNTDRLPLTYHLITGYGSNLGFFQECYTAGVYVVLNLDDMQGQLNNAPNNVSNLAWIHPAYSYQATCKLRLRSR